MEEILNLIVVEKQKIEDFVNQASSLECEELKLYEQLTSVINLENEARRLIKLQKGVEVHEQPTHIHTGIC